MSKQQTKADLEHTIAAMRAERENCDDALVRALALMVSGPDAADIKHLFFRRDGAALQVSLDMHSKDTDA
jgi:hypothetical protein